MGTLTTDAVVATVGNARVFKNGRQMAAWIGLVPRQFTTGGHARQIWAILAHDVDYDPCAGHTQPVQSQESQESQEQVA